MKTDRSERRGVEFSLVELTAVGVLGSLLLAVGKARSAACQSNFRQLATAWHW